MGRKGQLQMAGCWGLVRAFVCWRASIIDVRLSSSTLAVAGEELVQEPLEGLVEEHDVILP